jgi:GNAT superfamily N-acetyltransferase
MPKPVNDKFIAQNNQLFTIRPLVEEDLPALEWDGEYLHFRLLYRGHYQNSLWGNTRIWVAEAEDGEIVGQVFLMLLSRNEETADGVNRAYVFSFRVKEKVRNIGLGGFMMDFVENWAREHGFSHLRLNVERVNKDARRFYERHGFEVFGSDPGVWDFRDHKGVWHQRIEPAWKMIKPINLEYEP